MAACAFLAAYNNVIGAQSWHRRWYAPANACAAAAALAAAGASGLTAGEMGLGRGAWRPGRLASALAAATVGGYLAAAAMPVTRPLLNDKRVTTLDGPGLAYQVAFRIPVGTVLWEEIAFRGVLQAALRRVMPEPAAIAVASGVFGVWHIRPTAAALRVNQLARRPPAGRGPRGRRRRRDRRGRRAVLLAAGPLGLPGRARAAAPGHQLRRPRGRLDARPPAGGYGPVSRMTMASVTRSKVSPASAPAAVTSAARRAR